MKSALFVDFDNVYSGLRKLDVKIADQFAQKPQRWMQWLVSSLELPEHVPAEARRRVLVRRCYLNPHVYQRFRPSFNLAGFEIIDCPSLTSEGKTSTDIHMVLDIIDLLQHEARYDEFIVFSADADFTPVLRKLRRWDRRTTVLAIGFPSAAYRASADLLIDPDAFVRDALGFGDDDESTAVDCAPTDSQKRPTARDLTSAAREIARKTVASSSGPVSLARLASQVLADVDGMDASTWAGFGSFRQLVESSNLAPLQVIWENGGVILDPRRHSKPASAVHPQLDVADELAAITRLIIGEVARSSQPVACARVAQLVITQHASIAADWNGAGSFRKLLEALNLNSLKLDWNGAGGRIYDPARHDLSDVSAKEENGGHTADWGADDDLRHVASQINDVTNAPLITPTDFRVLFRVIAQDLAEHVFHLSETGKRVRDVVRDAGHPVSRADVTWVLRGLLLRGHEFGKGDDAATTLMRKTADNIRALCLREQMMIDAEMDQNIARWVGGSSDSSPPG